MIAPISPPIASSPPAATSARISCSSRIIGAAILARSETPQAITRTSSRVKNRRKMPIGRSSTSARWRKTCLRCRNSRDRRKYSACRVRGSASTKGSSASSMIRSFWPALFRLRGSSGSRWASLSSDCLRTRGTKTRSTSLIFGWRRTSKADQPHYTTFIVFVVLSPRWWVESIRVMLG